MKYQNLRLTHNPFISVPPTRTYDAGFRKLFTSRSVEVDKICRRASGGQALFVIAPFGGGKTVVLLEAMSRMRESGALPVYATFDRKQGFRNVILNALRSIEVWPHGVPVNRVFTETIADLCSSNRNVVLVVDDLDRATDIAEVIQVTHDVREILSLGANVVVTGQPFGVTHDLHTSAGSIFHGVTIPEFTAAEFRDLMGKYLESVRSSPDLDPLHPFDDEGAHFICNEMAAAKMTPRLFNFTVFELLDRCEELGLAHIPFATVKEQWASIAERAVMGLRPLQLQHLDIILRAKVISEDTPAAIAELGANKFAEYGEVQTSVLRALVEKNLVYVRKEQGKDQFRPTDHAITAMANLPVIVLLTANPYETHALLDVFLGSDKPAPNVTMGTVTYNELGTHGGHRIINTVCEMGAMGVGASQQRTREAIEHWRPRAVVAVGIAFGVDESKQSIGDVLISTQIQDYELGRLNNDGKITPRGDKPSSADALRNRFRQTDTSYSREAKRWPKVRFGLVLSGQKLVDNLDYRESLKTLFVEAIGGEMESVGMYVSAVAEKVDWIVVKAICDWGHGKNQTEKEANQQIAARNSALVVRAALEMSLYGANEVFAE